MQPRQNIHAIAVVLEWAASSFKILLWTLGPQELAYAPTKSAFFIIASKLAVVASAHCSIMAAVGCIQDAKYASSA